MRRLSSFFFSLLPVSLSGVSFFFDVAPGPGDVPARSCLAIVMAEMRFLSLASDKRQSFTVFSYVISASLMPSASSSMRSSFRNVSLSTAARKFMARENLSVLCSKVYRSSIGTKRFTRTCTSRVQRAESCQHARQYLLVSCLFWSFRPT